MGEKPKKKKEPWLAVVLSSFWAGIGQIYAGKFGWGSILLMVEIILHCVALWSWLSANCDILITAALYLVIMTFRIWNLFDAHKCVRRINSEDFETERKLGKDPWLALFLSDLIPGLGHLYLRKWIWSIVFIIVTVHLLVAVIMYPLLCVAIWAVFTAFVCFHSYMMTPLRRQKSKNMIVAISVAILCSHLLSHYTPFVFDTYVVEAFRLPTHEDISYFLPADKMSGGSMEPTLLPGDALLVRKSRKYIPKRGDVVAFKPPEDPTIPFVMRITALSNNTVEIKDRILYVNGQKIQQLDFETKNYPPDSYGIEEPYLVPKDHVFLLGDNSANSWDSRFFGAVPQSDIIGKAYKIYWPLSRRGPIK